MDSLAVPTPPDPIQRLVSGFVARQRSEATKRGYFAALTDFQRRMGAANIGAAVADLLSSRGRAHELADEYLSAMQGAKLSASTINQRVAALRALVSTAKTRDIVDWTLETRGLRKEGTRDTRGPGADGVRAVMAAIVGDDPIALRNRASMRLLYDLGLRREEVCRLDYCDLDVAGNRLAVLGKGHSGKAWLSFGDGASESPTLTDLRAWVAVRGTEAGPLFFNFDRSGKGGRRLTGNGLYKLLVAVAEKAGFPKKEHRVKCHGFRHAAVTEILDLTSGDVRAAAQFSRHANLNELITYDDNRKNLQGKMAQRLADASREKP